MNNIDNADSGAYTYNFVEVSMSYGDWDTGEIEEIGHVKISKQYLECWNSGDPYMHPFQECIACEWWYCDDEGEDYVCGCDEEEESP